MVVPYKGYLFDFDGTLARTMEDNCTAWQRAFKDYKVQLDPEIYYPLEGTPVVALAKLLCTHYKAPQIDHAELVRRKEEYYLKYNSFSLYPGVEELVARLHRAGARLGIVTAAQRSRLDRTLSPGFLSQFDAIICSNATPRGKPYPDSYLAGAKTLGLAPQDCVVIENAPLGIAAAKNAAMQCIGICSTVPAELLANADYVVKCFSDLACHPYFSTSSGS